MSIVIQGNVTADGRLELDDRLRMAPGRVQIVVEPLSAAPEVPADDPFWMRMQRIWDRRTASGIPPRSTEEVEAERDQVRDEWEERLEELEEIRRGGDPYQRYREPKSP